MMHPGRFRRSLFVAFSLLASVSVTACGSKHETSEPPPVAFDPSFLDASAEPCTDFYQYACGTWLAQHQVRAGFSVSRFSNGDYREDIYFSQLVEAMSSSEPGLLSAQRYYAGCLGAEHNPTTNAPALIAQLSLVNAMTSLADLPVTLASLQHSGVSAFFSAYPQIDPGNSVGFVLTLSDAGWSLDSDKAYLDSALAAAYVNHVTALASAASSAGLKVTLKGQPIVDFEAALAATSGSTAVSDPVSRYNPRTIAELSTQLPSFGWVTYLQTLGYSDVARVNVLSADFLPQLAALLAATPFDTLKQYLQWRILEAYGSHLDKPMFDQEFQFHRTVLYGQQRNPADDDFWCLLNTRDWFGFELAQHYVENFVPPDVKPNATALVESIRSAMRDNFSRVTWLDDATRVAAQQKLELLLPKVGYPDTWPGPRASLASSDSYLDMVIRMIRQARDADPARLNGPVDRTQFWASPEITNAFYSPARNDITIPVAVLQDPFFNPSRPAAFSYGALGAVVGHELTHAFDSNGRHFDGTGTLTDWWTEGSSGQFQARSQCLIDQYSGYEALPGSFVNGQATLNENIADLGGVKLAYAAFQATRPAGYARYTAEQQFFLSYAQLECANLSDEALSQRLATDVHSPPKFRVNGVLRNVPEFAEAFSCPAEAPLGPADRCDIW